MSASKNTSGRFLGYGSRDAMWTAIFEDMRTMLINCSVCGTPSKPFPRGGVWCPKCSPKLAVKR